jgi:hypothetical protein
MVPNVQLWSLTLWQHIFLSKLHEHNKHDTWKPLPHWIRLAAIPTKHEHNKKKTWHMETSRSRSGTAPCQGTASPPPCPLLAPSLPTTAIGVAWQSLSGTATSASLGLACGRWRLMKTIWPNLSRCTFWSNGSDKSPNHVSDTHNLKMGNINPVSNPSILTNLTLNRWIQRATRWWTASHTHKHDNTWITSTFTQHNILDN